MKRNGWQAPYHPLQLTTWVLFSLQQVYFCIYIALEKSLHASQSALSLLILVHLCLSLSVVKLAYDVTRCDTSYVSPEETQMLNE